MSPNSDACEREDPQTQCGRVPHGRAHLHYQGDISHTAPRSNMYQVKWKPITTRILCKLRSYILYNVNERAPPGVKRDVPNAFITRRKPQWPCCEDEMLQCQYITSWSNHGLVCIKDRFVMGLIHAFPTPLTQTSFQRLSISHMRIQILLPTEPCTL